VHGIERSSIEWGRVVEVDVRPRIPSPRGRRGAEKDTERERKRRRSEREKKQEGRTGSVWYRLGQ